MTRKQRYEAQLDELRARHGELLRSGRYLDAMRLSANIKHVEQMIAEAEAYDKAYEESLKPKPIKDILSREEINRMGIIPLMIECHLVADFLAEVSYMVLDTCKEHGLTDVSFMPELNEIIKRSEKFASFLATLSPDLGNMVARNETFNASLHKKYLKYIEQRLK